MLRDTGPRQRSTLDFQRFKKDAYTHTISEMTRDEANHITYLNKRRHGASWHVRSKENRRISIESNIHYQRARARQGHEKGEKFNIVLLHTSLLKGQH
jgi:hypothetical protein